MLFVDLLSSISGLLPLKSITDIDSPVSKLHYKFTSTFLLGSCVLVTATNLIGEPILCTFSEHPHLKDNVVNSFCWIHSTYTIASQYHNGPTVVGPGVGPHTKNDEKIYHTYYQWVPFVLFLQAFLFYHPRWLWSNWEGGKVASVSQELQSFVMDKDARKDKIQLLADYLHDSLKQHNRYALLYLFSELLNFVNTIFNIWLLNVFFNGRFASYGNDFFSFDPNEDPHQIHPKVKLFPRVTKCDFHTVGPSGTPQNLDIMCVLPHSIINEKVYLFLWVWLWVLLAGTILGFLWRCLAFFVPFVRQHLLTTNVQESNKNDIQSLCSKMQVGDYFLLYLLRKNVSKMMFSELVQKLASRKTGKGSNDLEMGEKGGAKGYYLMNEPR